MIDHLQTGGARLRDEGLVAGQKSARKNILLNEVSAQRIALEQGVINHYALDTSSAAGFEQLGDRLEIGGPVVASYRFNHFNRADGVIRAVVGVAVILQAQISSNGPGVQAFGGVSQLRWTECDACHLCAEFTCTYLGQTAPAAADFQHPRARARLNPGHTQRAAHLGVLRGLQVLLAVAVKPGRGIRHARV